MACQVRSDFLDLAGPTEVGPQGLERGLRYCREATPVSIEQEHRLARVNPCLFRPFDNAVVLQARLAVRLERSGRQAVCTWLGFLLPVTVSIHIYNPQIEARADRKKQKPALLVASRLPPAQAGGPPTAWRPLRPAAGGPLRGGGADGRAGRRGGPEVAVSVCSARGRRCWTGRRQGFAEGRSARTRCECRPGRRGVWRW